MNTSLIGFGLSGFRVESKVLHFDEIETLGADKLEMTELVSQLIPLGRPIRDLMGDEHFVLITDDTIPEPVVENYKNILGENIDWHCAIDGDSNFFAANTKATINDNRDFDRKFMTGGMCYSLVLIVAVQRVPEILKYLKTNGLAPSKIICPYFDKKMTNLDDQLDLRPICVFSYQMFGSGRFLPVINPLLLHYGFRWKNIIQQAFNPPSVRRFLRKQGIECSDMAGEFGYGDFAEACIDAVTESCLAQVEILDYQEYGTIHQSMNLNRFGELGEVRIICLLRDPRDYHNSILHRRRPENINSDEKRMKELMMDYPCRTNGVYPYHLNGKRSTRDLYQDMVDLKDHPDFKFIRFEELHADEMGTYRDLISWLKFDSILFPELSDQQLRNMVHLGSFEYQTGGKMKRGGDAKMDAYLSGISPSSARKGIVGDWVHNLPVDFVKLLQAEFTDILLELNYVNDTNWADEWLAART